MWYFYFLLAPGNKVQLPPVPILLFVSKFFHGISPICLVASDVASVDFKPLYLVSRKVSSNFNTNEPISRSTLVEVLNKLKVEELLLIHSDLFLLDVAVSRCSIGRKFVASGGKCVSYE